MAENNHGDGLELLAVGRALASQSHELKNVFAIIGESAGLMEDLLDIQAAERPESAPALERLRKSLATVQSQIARGHQLATDLNTLAHLPDHRASEGHGAVVLQQQAVLTVRLMARPASQAQVTVAMHPAAGDLFPSAQADPAACQAALLSLERWLIGALPPGSVLNIDAEEGGALAFGSKTPLPPAEETPKEVALLLSRAGLSLRHDGERLFVSLQGGEA